ncbi:hypothetical protein [Microbacterium sp. WCS2018Hpa-23]|uniref:hypothetical protein n=1 Tax=Microbacterium sp. WCS2018Hpa-23 TaxID=3073634 RepID=UPI0028831A59|nr:hypothetical protein [Microbacterium sp. WCS2018Hpa-23]
MAVDEDTAPTSLRTHRYLRLSLVFIVFALLTSVLIQTVVTSWEPFALGWDPPPSISHSFYTPARTVFVGALIAAALALLALSGRDRATTFLDISALFAPLIAIVPTGLANRQRIDGHECPDNFECVPVEFQGDMRLGIAVYVAVVFVAVLTMAVIRHRTRTPNPSARLVSIIALITAAVIAALAFVPALDENFPFNFWPVHSIHFVVTLLFFGVFAAVPILYAGGPIDAEETPPSPRQRSIYRWIAGLLIVDLLLLVMALLFRQAFGETPVVLFGEAVALILFASFWWVQTFQRWDDPDPPSIVARGPLPA